MVAITTRMGEGFPGRVSRSDSLTIEALPINNSTPPGYYGCPVKISSNQVSGLASGDAGSVVFGFLAQPYPIQGNSASGTIGAAATPPSAGMADVMRRGYMTVPLASGGGTPALGGQVYVVTTAGGSFTVGALVTSASPGSSAAAVAITNARFKGPTDASNNVEIEFAIAP